MTFYISLSPIGLFAHDNKGELVDSVIFTDLNKAKEQFIAAMDKQQTDEEAQLIKKIEKKDKEIIFEIPKEGYVNQFPNISGDTVRQNLPKLAQSTGFCKNPSDLYNHIHSLNMGITRAAVKKASTGDRFLIHAVNTIDELESSANMLAIRLKEWYALYFPELIENTRSNEKLASIISSDAHRDKISPEDAKDTIGADCPEQDIIPMHRFATEIHNIYLHKKELEEYILKKSKEIMPNASELISPMLAARFLAIAGSLEKLSKFPSSTIQVLGAEKALFRHIRGNGTSPKHGIIFQSPLVNQASRKTRGKVSRMLASKLSIAFKMDYFDKKLKGGKKLKEDLDKRLQNLKG